MPASFVGYIATAAVCYGVTAGGHRVQVDMAMCSRSQHPAVQIYAPELRAADYATQDGEVLRYLRRRNAPRS